MIENLIVAFLLIGGAYFFWLIFKKGTRVQPPTATQARVLYHILIPDWLIVLRSGGHVLLPGWKVLTDVVLNREPVEKTSEEAKAKAGETVLVSYRYDMLAGRPFDGQTGVLDLRGGEDPDAGPIDDPVIILAATRIDFGDRDKVISQQASVAIENELANYAVHDLVNPTRGIDVCYVPVPNRRNGTVRWEHRTVYTLRDLYKTLSLRLEYLLNRSLRRIGINVVDFKITNLTYADPELRKALESRERMRRLNEAAGEVRGNLTDREKMGATLGEFGETAAAEAERDKAKAYRALARAWKEKGVIQIHMK